MKFFLSIVFVLCISRNILGEKPPYEWIQYEDEMYYEDLIHMNASCFPFDSCMEDHVKDPPPNFHYKCSCDRECWEIGTCCIDSPYRVKPPIKTCRKTKNQFEATGYYMLDRCPDNTYSDSIWKNLCEKEWNNEDDILMLSPVTSLETSRTYKNYYCFKCSETTDKYISWNLFLESTYDISSLNGDYSVNYDKESENWMVTSVDNHASVPVNMSFQYPYNMLFYPTSCDLTLISNCPDSWTDELVRDRCHAYTALVYRELKTYKNAHCALCNYVSLDSITCIQSALSTIGHRPLFSFQHLLNINDSVADKVGNKGKCDKEHLWDPYSKKCRKRACALPGYVIKDNRCVPP